MASIPEGCEDGQDPAQVRLLAPDADLETHSPSVTLCGAAHLRTQEYHVLYEILCSMDVAMRIKAVIA